MSIAHPAAREELAHFEEALAVIEEEREGAQRRQGEALRALEQARRTDPDNLPVREMQFTLAQQEVRELGLARKKPYFTRVDFTPSGDEPQRWYIGKNGVTRGASMEPYVIDWRAPIANLYYSGQVGPMEYTSPEGVVRGEMTLKRQFGVEDGQLKTIFDSGIAAQDEFLQSVLGSVTGARLTEIVTTIQAEQNAIIRHPLKRSLVVQGVAGSGKTSIALHRIAYLLYTWQDRLRPEQTLILAPNPLFLQYIAPVLPDLGVERVRQTTFSALVGDWLGKALPPVATVAEGACARCKGRLSTVRRLEEWLEDWEQKILPEGSLRFGPVELYSPEELRQFLLVDEKPFPMERRLRELKKQLNQRVKRAAAELQQWYRREAQRRAIRLQGDAEKREKLFAQLEQRLAAVEEKARGYAAEAMRSFGDSSPAQLYRRFWQDMERVDDPELRSAAAHTLGQKGRGVEPEDVALIALIARKVVELPRPDVRHVVVDEAQDMSPAEFYLLRQMHPAATFTLVGDMMQGVRMDRGLESWKELDAIFGENLDLRELVTSYRSTVEIIQLARRVWENFPAGAASSIQPVLRHGEEPAVEQTDNPAQRIARQLEEWKALPSVAVITATAREADALIGRLPPGARRLDVHRGVFETGVVVGSAAECKGLEFDGVILADASARQYPAQAGAARLLYVALTRALHRVRVFYQGEKTPLLQ